MDRITTVAGWVGMALIVIAYFLISTKRVNGTNKYYQGLNILGSIGIGANVFYQHAWPSVALQIVWITIGLYSLAHNLRAPAPLHRHGHHPEHVVAKGRLPD